MVCIEKSNDLFSGDNNVIDIYHVGRVYLVVAVNVGILIPDDGGSAFENVVVDADYVCAVDLSVAVDIATGNPLDCQSLSYQQFSLVLIELFVLIVGTIRLGYAIAAIKYYVLPIVDRAYIFQPIIASSHRRIIPYRKVATSPHAATSSFRTYHHVTANGEVHP